MIITIDGPAGSGKSTMARSLAARLGVPYLDTGAMYRVVTLAALEDGLDLQDDERLARLAGGDAYELEFGPTQVRVALRGREVSEEIRSLRVSSHTHYVAALPGVRAALVERQRQIGRRLRHFVTEGRDQGSVAFPDADLKFFLDASLETRAARRLQDLQSEGDAVTLARVKENLRMRDETDSSRAVGPLRRPDGAICIDTSGMSVAQVLDCMLEHVARAGLTPPHQTGGTPEGSTP